MNFTDEQNAILAHDCEHHAQILAGPGTGKSSTIIAYVAKVRQEQPDKQVRLLTFTRAANSELSEKIEQEEHENVQSSTIHSFSISVLLSNPGSAQIPEPLRIADGWEWSRLIKPHLARLLESSNRQVESLKNEMSAYWSSLVREHDDEVPIELRGRFTGTWTEHRTVFQYCLLGELPYRLKIALESNKELDIGSIDLIAVDEFQDLNACDLECIWQLKERGVTVIAIGDDDQSIYGFRKAAPEGIRSFPERFNAESYPLSISHRCGHRILQWSNFVISGDTTRPAKVPLQPSGDNPDGSAAYLIFNREDAEGRGVARLVKWLSENEHERVPLKGILILVRTRRMGHHVKEALREHLIPFKDPVDSEAILYESATRLLLCRLRLLINCNDSLAWWTVFNLTHGLGQRVIDELYNLAIRHNEIFGNTVLSQLQHEFSDVSRSGKLLTATVREIIEAIERIDIPPEGPWGQWILERIESGELPNVSEEMNDLFSQVDEFQVDSESSGLDQYINRLEPTIKDISNAKQDGYVRIMNIQSSKGLTVEATILAGCEDEVIPFPDSDLKEERRLLYVAMTRAKKHLYITRALRRIGPTARVGRSQVGGQRTGCRFIDGGPVHPTNGDQFLAERNV